MAQTCLVCCNQCFESNADVKHKFFVTSCYHVFCAGCLTNNRSVCNVCKKKCKILPIDNNLPREIKTYFEPNYHRQLFGMVAKVHDFQLTQVKNYAEKDYRGNYYRAKEKVKQLSDFKKKVVENMKRENAIMDKLKDAYRTNVITTDLFQMRSQAGSPQGLKIPENFTDTPKNSLETPRSSSSSLIFKSRNDKETRTQELRHNLTLSNFNRDSQKVSQRSHYLGPKDVIKEARKGFIANTLRDMNQFTQNKQQVKNSQRHRINFLR